MSIRLFALLLIASLGLAACGGETAEPAAPEAPAATTPEPAAEPAAEAAPFDGPALDITLTPVGDEMKFEQTEFEVQPGQTVNLTFNNTATMETMHHNVVVVKSRADIMPVGQGGMSAADNDYIPSDKMDVIIAHTAMSAPGETVTVTFTAPLVPGEYPYICTFPGHFMSMQGVMKVAG